MISWMYSASESSGMADRRYHRCDFLFSAATFASRVAASILNEVNLNELVTKNKNDYQNLAIDIGNDKKKLSNLKDKLKGSISKSNLFNSILYTKHLEDLFINLSKKNK